MVTETARIDEILDRFPQIKRNALIPLLQAVQDEFGYISEEAIVRIGAHLSLPTSKVYGLATFYNQFSFSPRGVYHIALCNGSSCHLGGSGELFGELIKLLEIGDGETTRDGLFSLEVQSCIGACGQSPVMAVNGTYFSGITVKELREIIKQYREDASG
ncbi:MAG: NAD(P)H-dependent oxidoreductase subunit E [Bacteroidales bacterium]|nr:NAD(P)H-dependent oxidoreductase subunit E [Bacteroidales bacterium]